MRQLQKNKEFAMDVRRRAAFGWAQWVLLMVFYVVMMEVEVVDGEKNNYYYYFVVSGLQVVRVCN